MNCDNCGNRMRYEGIQHNPIRQVKFGLHSCTTALCPRKGFTVSSEPVEPTAEELAEYRAFQASQPFGSDYRAGVAAST